MVVTELKVWSRMLD